MFYVIHLRLKHKESAAFIMKTTASMAGVTGLEPAASGVTGQRSNQLSYTPKPFVKSPERAVESGAPQRVRDN